MNSVEKVKEYVKDLGLKPGFIKRDGSTKLNPSLSDIKNTWRFMDIETVLKNKVATPFEFSMIVDDFCNKNNILHFNVCIIVDDSHSRTLKVYSFVNNEDHGYFEPINNIVPYNAMNYYDAILHMMYRVASSIPEWKKVQGGMFSFDSRFSGRTYVGLESAIKAKLQSLKVIIKSLLDEKLLKEINKYKVLV